MIKTNLFSSSEARSIVAHRGAFSVIEYERDLSVSPETSEAAYFASMMHVRKRQLVVTLSGQTGVITQAGSMQLMLGDIEASADISSVGNLVKKFVGSRVTGESTVKPKYTGEGTLVLEPNFNHIFLEDISEWGDGMVIEDKAFLACEGSIELTINVRSTVSSAALGGEGLFNTCLVGDGIAAIESPVPRSELIEVILDNDTVKIDGSMAIAWSKELEFTVERTTATLVGSMISGEGLVNTYRGSGKILIAPVRGNDGKEKNRNSK